MICPITFALLHYIYTVIFLHVIILVNAEVWVFRVDLFLKMNEILRKIHEKGYQPLVMMTLWRILNNHLLRN